MSSGQLGNSWVLDAPALDLPLFPGVDEKTGCFLFTETYDVERLGPKVKSIGTKIGMGKKVGAWSFRKDACEQPAAAGDGEVAARVLGHRHVNSRTMDRVYRADLRTRDLGAYWMRREGHASVAKEPLTSLSASRVVESSGVLQFDDVPVGPERTAVENDVGIAAAEARVVKARAALASRLGVPHLPTKFKNRAKELGCADELAEYDQALVMRSRARGSAQSEAMETYRLRLYKQGLEKLRTTPELKSAMLSTHTWAARTEDYAIAFGLDRKDRTRELTMLRKLPATLQGSILKVGALHVLPATGGSIAKVYEHVRRQSEGICTLRCKASSCSEEADCEWAKTADAFDDVQCPHCGGELSLYWRRETEVSGSHIEPLALGAGTLGTSYVEYYGVWYNLCARATVGNTAFVAGAAATVTPDVVGGPEQQMLDSTMLPEVAEMLDDEMLQDMSQEM